MGTCHAEHAMTEPFDECLELHGDECVVLDDEDVGCYLGSKLASRFLDQCSELDHVDIEDVSRVRLRESFERNQEEGLARKGCDMGELLLPGQRRIRSAPRVIHGYRIPDFGE